MIEDLEQQKVNDAVGDGPAVIDFWMENCPPCNMMEPKLKAAAASHKHLTALHNMHSTKHMAFYHMMVRRDTSESTMVLDRCFNRRSIRQELLGAAERMRRHVAPRRRALLLYAAVLAIGFGFAARAAAQEISEAPGIGSTAETINKHEPIFGLGPRTIWKGGSGLEVGLDRDKSEVEESWGLNYHTLYGISANWSVTAEMHQVLEGSGDHAAGLSDLTIRTKYRFYRNDIPGGVYHAAILGGFELPTATGGLSEQSSADFIGGLSGAFEGRRWLVFLTGRYRVNTEGSGGVRRGNVFLYDAAAGIRPVKTGYYAPDVVLMAELNGQIFADREVRGKLVEGTGGDRLLAGFGAWITYRNWAFKPGIQVPIYNDAEGGDLDYRFVAAVEFHI